MPDDRDELVDELAAEWLRRARADMTVAALTDDERIAPEIAAFHAQQAAEKALKAVLVRRQVDFPRTHSIGVLLAICEDAEMPGVEDLADASGLTRYAVAARYPTQDEPVSRQEAREAATLAAQVFVWAFAQIQASARD